MFIKPRHLLILMEKAETPIRIQLTCEIILRLISLKVLQINSLICHLYRPHHEIMNIWQWPEEHSRLPRHYEKHTPPSPPVEAPAHNRSLMLQEKPEKSSQTKNQTPRCSRVGRGSNPSNGRQSGPFPDGGGLLKYSATSLDRPKLEELIPEKNSLEKIPKPTKGGWEGPSYSLK